MTNDPADECKAYHAKIEQSIDDLLRTNQELQAEIDKLKGPVNCMACKCKNATEDSGGGCPECFDCKELNWLSENGYVDFENDKTLPMCPMFKPDYGELKELQNGNNHLHELIHEQGIKITEYERNPIIPKYAELQAEYERLKAENDELKTKPAESEPDIRDKIIALIAPAIEFKEQFYVNGEYKELVTLYREYRPKEVNGNEHKTL